ncbi:glycosyltransferase family 2 protein [Sporofaciens sp. JLR.KK001]|jgi:glycosyltransferase involved in cell wall biosynthesis|uniref:glycosyltransferase family 2 protein n=1 Tax=Sporofaciens sp. JLR.KK001 TaxID=3112621 RepID=UPI002FF063E8
MDLISVIVPVFKVEQYLKRCVSSILNQSYKNIEIILVDDGSPDNCPEICDDLSSKYSNITVIHKKNGGLSSARNAGLEKCNGRYISFVDSDDFIDKNFINRLYECIIKYDADVAMVMYEETFFEKKVSKIVSKKERIFINEEVEKAFLRLKIDSVCVGLYSSEIVKKYRFIEGKTSEDIPFNFEIFREIKSFVFIPEKRYYYFYNPKSISNGILDKNMLNYLDFRKQIFDYYSEKNNECKKIAEALYVRAAMGLQTHMAIYGISKDLNEKECKRIFSSIYRNHRKTFFVEKTIPMSRKLLAILIFDFYGIIKIMRMYIK